MQLVQIPVICKAWKEFRSDPSVFQAYALNRWHHIFPTPTFLLQNISLMDSSVGLQLQEELFISFYFLIFIINTQYHGCFRLTQEIFFK